MIYYSYNNLYSVRNVMNAFTKLFLYNLNCLNTFDDKQF